ASGETVNANVVLDSFADNISRQKAAQVFALPPFLEDEKKAVADYIKIIKLAYCDKMIATGDLSVMVEFAERKKSISTFF
ncbi:MAG: hypothetical protein LBM16_04945, partial [Clostridiales bacterium]|nr:hypothetical protein [Clostridiales bacterium]